MTPAGAAHYLGGALAYAGAVTLLVLALAWLAGRRPGLSGGALILAMAFPVFLGLHPFPDPARLDCSAGGAPLILYPFDFIDGYRRLWNSGEPVRVILRSRGFLAPLMNVLLFAPIGAALAWRTGRWRVALAVGLGVTFFIEIAQLSALFGLYPCRYRHFETGDMILNTAGVTLGFALMRWAGAGRGQPRA